MWPLHVSLKHSPFCENTIILLKRFPQVLALIHLIITALLLKNTLDFHQLNTVIPRKFYLNKKFSVADNIRVIAPHKNKLLLSLEGLDLELKTRSNETTYIKK